MLIYLVIGIMDNPHSNSYTFSQFYELLNASFQNKLELNNLKLNDTFWENFTREKMGKLDLSFNRLTTIAFNSNQQLTTLDLSMNLIGRISKGSIDWSFLLTSNIIDLNLSNNELNDKHACDLFRTLRKKSTLEYLNVSSSLLSHDALVEAAIAIFIGKTKLKSLNLSHNLLGKLSKTQVFHDNDASTLDKSHLVHIDDPLKYLESFQSNEELQIPISHSKNICMELLVIALNHTQTVDHLNLEYCELSTACLQHLNNIERLTSLNIGMNETYLKKSNKVDLSTIMSKLDCVQLHGIRRMASSEADLRSTLQKNDIPKFHNKGSPVNELSLKPTLESNEIESLFRNPELNMNLKKINLSYSVLTTPILKLIMMFLLNKSTQLEIFILDGCYFDANDCTISEFLFQLISSRTLKYVSLRYCNLHWNHFKKTQHELGSAYYIGKLTLDQLNLDFNGHLCCEDDDTDPELNEKWLFKHVFSEIKKVSLVGCNLTKHDSYKYGGDYVKQVMTETEFHGILQAQFTKPVLLRTMQKFLRLHRPPWVFHMKELNELLNGIKTHASINKHVRLSKIAPSTKETVIKSLLKTDVIPNLYHYNANGRSCKIQERRLFGTVYDKHCLQFPFIENDEDDAITYAGSLLRQHKDTVRPKYASLNLTNYVFGCQPAKQDGLSYMAINPKCKQVSTITSRDSVHDYYEIGTFENMSHVLLDMLFATKRILVLETDPVTKKQIPKRYTYYTYDGIEKETFEFKNESIKEKLARTLRLIWHLIAVYVDKAIEPHESRLGLMPNLVEVQIHGELPFSQVVDFIMIHQKDRKHEDIQPFLSDLEQKCKLVTYNRDACHIPF